jgi:hypothetical protein
VHRLGRHLFTCSSALSVLLGIAVGVFWVRSYRMLETISWRGDSGWRCISSASGDVEISLLSANWSQYPYKPRGFQYQRDRARLPFNYIRLLGGSVGDQYNAWEWRGFAWRQVRNTGSGVLHGHGVIPFWAVALATTFLPLGWIGSRWRSRTRRRRLHRKGVCLQCGYDLRATPERCPECGALPA